MINDVTKPVVAYVSKVVLDYFKNLRIILIHLERELNLICIRMVGRTIFKNKKGEIVGGLVRFYRTILYLKLLHRDKFQIEGRAYMKIFATE